MTKRVNENLFLENIQILPPPWRNFSGKVGPFNKDGGRNFVIAFYPGKNISEEDLAAIIEMGWNVKERVDERDGSTFYFIKVNVKFENWPPVIYKVGDKTKNQTLLNEDSVGVLDGDRIIEADAELSPYNYDVNGNTGVSAYLRNLLVVVEESEFDLRMAERRSRWNIGDPIFVD